MDLFAQSLNTLDGGNILDVATGAGSFALLLKENLKSFTSITGVDSSSRAIERAQAAVQDPHIHFQLMDALHLDFSSNSFDTVCISNSLHHLDDPAPVISEMLRVLKPDGKFILFEMFQDDPTPTQLTAVLLHHWWGKIDTACGTYHAPTYTRQQLLQAVNLPSLKCVTSVEIADDSGDPREESLLKELDGIINQYEQKASGLPIEEECRMEGETLRKRTLEIGFHSATELLWIGQKVNE